MANRYEEPTKYDLSCYTQEIQYIHLKDVVYILQILNTYILEKNIVYILKITLD